MRHYVTTAIDYPNAPPHMGHVLEKVLADVVARWFRLQGHEVRFQIGTDEHGIKIQRTAEKEGVTPRELVDRNVPLFQDLYSGLNVSYDKFIRTSNEKEHYPTVQALWKKLEAAGVLEKRSYTGLYCSGCERFMTKRDLEDGKCPNHRTAPEEVTEENWFLTMSDYGKELRNLLTKEWDGESYRIVPDFRAKETLSLIDQGLEDVSFSRPGTSLSWGVPVPGDEQQTMYVWCDALTNYISGLGFFTDHEESEWWNDARITHVIGKDIARFHALIWPLMLKKAGVRIPDELLIHGFLTSEGDKMSKSLGNVVVPDDILQKFAGNPDPLRFYLSHEVPVGRDGDFSWERFEKLYDAKLRNNLGNLLNRILVMLDKEGGSLVQINNKSERGLHELIPHQWEFYVESMDSFELHNAINIGGHNQIVDFCNQDISLMKPWEMDSESKMRYLSELSEAMRHVSLMLLPFIPDTAYRISKQLNVPYAEAMLSKDFVITNDMKQWGGCKDWKTVGTPEILFAPLEDSCCSG